MSEDSLELQLSWITAGELRFFAGGNAHSWLNDP